MGPPNTPAAQLLRHPATAGLMADSRTLSDASGISGICIPHRVECWPLSTQQYQDQQRPAESVHPYSLERHRNLNPQHGPCVSLGRFRGSHPYPVTLTRDGYQCHKTSTAHVHPLASGTEFLHSPVLPLRLLTVTHTHPMWWREGHILVLQLWHYGGTNVSSVHAPYQGIQKPQVIHTRSQNVEKASSTSHTSKNVDNQPRSPKMSHGHKADLHVIENTVIVTKSLSYPVQIQP